MSATKKGADKPKAPRKSPATEPKPRCGLCGKTRKLTQTECCGQWICNDEDKYELFSYARNSCHRNHHRYTLCGFHHVEEHGGDWKDCPECREAFDTEMYVWYGTNEHNFEKLENPPEYEPTRCAKCDRIIVLTQESFSMTGGKYSCSRCTMAR